MTEEHDDVLIMNEQPENDQLDYEFRVILIQQKFNQVNSDLKVEESQMSERILSGIDSFTLINEFFDKFDEKIAYPNEGHIKYDLGSDGVIVIVVETTELRDSVLKFVDEYLVEFKKLHGEETSDNNQEEEKADAEEDKGGIKKKQRKQ
ncbi:unnamed protein product [Ambrosiozyma monospora]|uniref:Unnamed protein product n=1 Tax=Ambrosiozyma monospora TaxID=43982 RepID=A0ACB5T7N0_AMBMO|nr:unnamed protein product [Ambrosiozyma monospora]